MSYFKFNNVFVAQNENLIRVYFDHRLGFQFSSNKGYVDFVDIWVTQSLMKGLIKNGNRN